MPYRVTESAVLDPDRAGFRTVEARATRPGVDLARLYPRRFRRRERMVYLPDLQAVVAARTPLDLGWRCDVVARRHLHRPGLEVDLRDWEVDRADTVMPVSPRPTEVESRMLWQAWTWQRLRGPRVRRLCRVLVEDLRTPHTLTVDLHAGAVACLRDRLGIGSSGLRRLVQHLVAVGAATPVSPGRADGWGRLVLLPPVLTPAVRAPWVAPSRPVRASEPAAQAA
jgi:hypothetical protein